MKRTSAVAAAALCAAAIASPTASAQESVGFRIRSWVEWDDQRIEGGQGFIGGPYGLRFVVKARFEESAFEILVRPVVTPDSTRYYAFIEARQPAGPADSATGIFVFDSYNRLAAVSRAQSALLTVPFQPEARESANLRIQIDGPYAGPIEGRRPWIEEDADEPRGIRVSVAGAYPRLEVLPSVTPGSVALRISQEGSPEGIRVLAATTGSTEFRVPGLSPRWIVTRHPTSSVSRPGERCFSVFRAAPPDHRGPYTPEDTGEWCVPGTDRWGVASVTTRSGIRLRVQEVP